MIIVIGLFVIGFVAVSLEAGGVAVGCFCAAVAVLYGM